MAQELQIADVIEQLSSDEKFISKPNEVTQLLSEIIALDSLSAFAKCTRKFLTDCLTVGTRLMMLVHFYECQVGEAKQEQLSELLKKFVQKFDHELDAEDFRVLEILLLKLVSLAPFFVSAEKIFIGVGWQLHQSFEINLTIIYQKALVRSKNPIVHRIMDALEKFQQLFSAMGAITSRGSTAVTFLLDSQIAKYQIMLGNSVN